MVKLAMLLMGAAAMQRRWLVLTGVGIAWISLALLIIGDAADGVTVVATETFGVLLLIEGTIAGVAAVASAMRGGRLVLVRALAFILFGLLILDFPWNNDIANSLLFGLALLVDGIVRIAAAHVLRHPRWKLTVLGGSLEVALAALALSNWPVGYNKTVPFCIGVALLLSGLAILRFGLLLRRLPPNASVTDLPLFRQRGWHPTFGIGEGLEWLFDARPEQPLIVHVWTPTGSAKDAARRPVLDRYVAAVDRKGMVSTGHASLALSPALYISHYPQAETERSGGDFVRSLRATAENNVPGRFLESYEVEASHWFPADAHVAFHRCNTERLAAFWRGYSASNTYNLTNRNCSIVVAVALDAALEGVLADRKGWFSFLRLMVNPDLWFAAALRSRAEALTWTPGLILDYARALRRVVEPRRGISWRVRIVHAIKQYRSNRARAADAKLA
jgi:uncharacterized membrane protein HdeD (DUF308 family)